MPGHAIMQFVIFFTTSVGRMCKVRACQYKE